MIKVLMVGQTPPPHVGQFIMIEKMMDAKYDEIQIFPLKMSFSQSVDEIGSFRISKVFRLLSTVLRIWFAKLRHQPDMLYYPPAGPKMIPIYRDIFILLTTRWMFKKTIFHYHAGGLSEVYEELSGVKRWLFKKAYFGADLAIRLAAENPEDGKLLHAKKHTVIPYGIADHFSQVDKESHSNKECPQLLFLGMLRETKGLFVFLEACHILNCRGVSFSARLVGGFVSGQEATRANEYIDEYRLRNIVEISGVLTGKAKWNAYRDADIFCMPSHYESETFGLVAVEAMQFKLPVVATYWRGLQSIVKDGDTGFLVPTKDSEALSQKLAYLVENSDERALMGENSRKRYQELFSERIFIDSFEREILSLN